MTSTGPRLFVGGTQSIGSPWAKLSATNPDATPIGIPNTPQYMYTFVPTVLATANIAALQTTAGAANLVLTAGTGVTLTTFGGRTVYLFNDVTADGVRVARNVTLTSAGNISAVTFTITGVCAYGNVVVQTLAGPNANTVATTKTFVGIISVAASAAVGTNTSVGTGDAFGFPVAVSSRHFITPRWAAGATEDTGTFVAAVTTTPATATTGDVRGTYTPSTASNGTNRLSIEIIVPDSNLQTPSLVYGVPQFGG